MHKTLALVDVVAEILAYLAKGSLAAMAQTCKTLSSPALDILWRDMASLDPLYMTLPNGVWTTGADGRVTVGPMTPAPEDWTRFSEYAGRIRELSFARDMSGLRPALLRLVMRYLPSLPNPPLPRLHALRIERASDAEMTLCLTALARAKLRILEVVWPSPDIGVSMLSFMQLTCPNIQVLVLGGARGLLPMVTRFTQLQKLVYDDPDTTLDTRTLLALARLPHLRHLSITSEFSSLSFTKNSEDEADGAFPSLKELSFENVTGVRAVAHFLRFIKSPSLRSISLKYTLPERGPAKELRALANSIALHADLVALSLYSREPTPASITERDILALATLAQLRKVCLTDILPYTSTRCAPSKTLFSWTKIQSIHIDCAFWRSGIRRGVCPTLRVLEKLFKTCPQLTDLRSPLSVSEIPVPRSGCSRERRLKPLRLTASISTSNIDRVDPYDVAEYLSDVCPGIEVLFEENSDIWYPEMYGKWVEVNRWIARLNAVRVAERQRIEL